MRPLPAPFIRALPEQTALAVSSEHSVITLLLMVTPGIPDHSLITRICREKRMCRLYTCKDAGIEDRNN